MTHEHTHHLHPASWLPRPESFVHLPLDAEVLTGDTGTEQVFNVVNEDDSIGEFERKAVTILLSREQMLDHGLAQPTPEEAERRQAQLVEWRAREAERADRRRRWLVALDDMVGPVGRAVLALHTRTNLADCSGCHEQSMWPCPTVEAVADAVGVRLPEGI